MNRRGFLAGAGAAALLPAVLPFAAQAGATDPAADRVLVLVELAGGNDGLNTVVPYADPAYRRLRPGLAVARDQVVQLDGAVGLHPALAPLMPAWRDRNLAVALGVGYPRPNRSHFRSIDIWESGSDSAQVIGDGWVARLWDGRRRARPLAADAIILGGGGDIAAGGDARSITLHDPQKFVRQAERMQPRAGAPGNPALRHLLTVRGEIDRAARELRAAEARAPRLTTSFPAGPLGRQAATAARLIAAKTPVMVVKLSLPGFDTHRGQIGRHANLLKSLAEALAAFRNAMIETGDWHRILVMTYSEFGRRAAQNGSMGTDHGTAAPHLVMGGQVSGGLYGRQPSLGDLEGGDLKHVLDFRALYATVAERWWGLPAAGSPFAEHRPLPLIAV